VHPVDGLGGVMPRGCVIVVERFFYAISSAHCSGMFIVFGSTLAETRGQKLSVSRRPKRCARRSDRQTVRRFWEHTILSCLMANGSAYYSVYLNIIIKPKRYALRAEIN
jgi:hypothetical protein